MSSLSKSAGLESLRSGLLSTRLLTSACSCAERVQASLVGLGGASNLLLLGGVGANLLVSYLSNLSLDSNQRLRQATAGLAGSLALGSDLA